MKTLLVFVLFAMLVFSPSIALAQDEILTPVMPACDEFADVIPTSLIGGNVTVSMGGLDYYDSYLEQHSGETVLTLAGEKMFGDDLTLEGCFVDPQEFWLFGTKGSLEVVFVGIVVEQDFGDPSFGGLWFGWSKGYDPEITPDQKGFFFKLF
jgi:hypothetical protein